MIFNEIRKMAKGKGINTYRMRKTDMIRAIQVTEKNVDCYGTQRIESCHEDECLWINDCLSLTHHLEVNSG
jgi:hypothetical protein